MRALLRFVSPLVAVILSAAGCGRDFTVPTTPPAPHVTGFSPASAYAGQLVRIEGTGFAAKAADDRVAFPGGATTAESVTTDGAILVRVPADVFDGPLSVTTAAGTGVSKTDFQYLGYGTLRRGVIQGTFRVHNAPRVMAVAGGEPVIWSTLFEDLVDTQGRWFVPPGLMDPTFATVGGATYVGFKWKSSVLLLDPVTRRTTTACDLGASFGLMALAADPSTTGLVILDGPLGVATPDGELRTFDPITGGLSAPRPTTVRFVASMTALGDGRLLVLGTDDQDCNLFVLDPTGATVTTTCLDGRVQGLQPMTITGLDVGGRATAVVSFTDGGLALFDVDGSGPVGWVDSVATEPVQGLAVATTSAGPRVVGVRPTAPSALSVDPTTAKLEWEMPLGVAPWVLSTDGGRLFVADTADDRIRVLDVLTAAPLGEADVGVSFGSYADRRRGMALATLGGTPTLLVPDTRDHALVAIDPADPAGDASAIDLPGIEPTGVAVGPDQTIWVLGDGWAGHLDVVDTAAGTRYVPSGGPVVGAPVDVAPTPAGDAYVADDAGVVACDADGTVTRLLDATQGWVRRLFLRPDGTLDVVFELDGGQAHVERLDPADPSTPLAKVDSHPAGTDSLYDAVMIDGRLMLLFSGMDSDSLVPLDPDTLEPGTAVGGWWLNDLQPLAVSPNGREVLADTGGTQNPGTGQVTGTLGVLGVLPDRPVVARSRMFVEGTAAAAAFGPRGERAYAPVTGTDEIVILE